MLSIQDIATKVASRNNKSYWFSKKIGEDEYKNVDTPSEGVSVWFSKEVSEDDFNELQKILAQHNLHLFSNSMLAEDHPKYEKQKVTKNGCYSYLALPINA